MELSFNDKITGKLQNNHFKLIWICLLVKNNCYKQQNIWKTVLLKFWPVILMSHSINYLVGAPHCLNFNRFHDLSPLHESNKLLTSDVK